MSNVTCPHCDTANPQNAAYCQRCQRPLGAAKPAGNLAPASQVAQQILQRRPATPATAAPQTMPSAAQVAAQLMQRRAQDDATAVERTVVERVPLASPQRSAPPPAPKAAAPAPAPRPAAPAPASRPAAPAPPPAPRPAATAPVAQAKPSPWGDTTATDRTVPSDLSTETTKVFTVPKSLHDDPTRNARPDMPPRAETPSRVNPAIPAAPRPAAAPALPQPAMQRDVLPGAREPAPKPTPKRNAEIQDRRGTAVSVLRDGVPPQRPAPLPPEATAMDIEYAAGWRLLLSHVVDLTLLGLVCVLFAKLDASLSGPHGIETSGIFDWIGSHPGSTLRAGVVTALVGTAYHVVMAQLSGRTVGRMVAGTTLTRRSGKPLNTVVIVVRAVASFASLLMFGAGFFWAIVDRRGRGFHDLVAGTMVVRYHG